MVERVVKILIKNNIIHQQDSELYQYGLTLLITMTLDIENDYRTMRAELQSNIRNPLSCIKTSCFLINSLAEKNIQSEKLQEYLQIIEKAAEDIESALK